ncbi:lachrymatory-factor synthase-like [Wolffia australiana]
MGEEREGGSVEAEVKGATAEQAWKFFDFSILDKVSSIVESCTIVEGVPGEPGCVRYCVTKPVPPPGGAAGGEGLVMHMKETLLAIDHAQKTFSYDIAESNIGLRGYIANVKVYGEDGVEGCRVVWSFSADSFGVFAKAATEWFLTTLLRSIVYTIEQAVLKGEV